MKTCAFCQETSNNLTGEHIYPYGLISKFPEHEYARVTNNNFVKLSPRKQVVKDVCKKCNNGPLSKLDTYGNNFIIENFSDKIKPDEIKTVNYQFDPLHKWIMKIMYNGLRHHEEATNWLRKNSRYLIDEVNATSSKFTLLLGSFVDLAPLAGMAPDLPFNAVANPGIIEKSRYLGGAKTDKKLYDNENIEVIYVLRLCNAIFILVVWKEDRFNQEEELDLINMLPHSVLEKDKDQVDVERVTDGINSPSLEVVCSRQVMKVHDKILYEMFGPKKK